MKSTKWNKIAVFICLLVMIMTVFLDNLTGTTALGFLGTINTMIILNDK